MLTLVPGRDLGPARGRTVAEDAAMPQRCMRRKWRASYHPIPRNIQPETCNGRLPLSSPNGIEMRMCDAKLSSGWRCSRPANRDQSTSPARANPGPQAASQLWCLSGPCSRWAPNSCCHRPSKRGGLPRRPGLVFRGVAVANPSTCCHACHHNNIWPNRPPRKRRFSLPPPRHKYLRTRSGKRSWPSPTRWCRR